MPQKKASNNPNQPTEVFPKKLARKLSKVDNKIAWREEKINKHTQAIGDLRQRRTELISEYHEKLDRKQLKTSA